jgi:hypothetical protein
LEKHLLLRLSREKSIVVRRKLVDGLGYFVNNPKVEKELKIISNSSEEDPIVQRNAIRALKRKKYR